jgi:hypothetical protein
LGSQKSVALSLSDEVDGLQAAHAPQGGILLWLILMLNSSAKEA